MKINHVCEHCGKTFSTYPGSKTYHPTRFCSRNCYAASKLTPEAIMERFWSKVNRTEECWMWTGGRFPNGYGKFSIQGTSHLAHRVSFEFENGDLSEEIEILHHCDNPACVRPGHLFAGTQQDNMDDMLTKGRGNPAKGEQSGVAKLTEDNVQEMCKLYVEGYGRKYICERFHISLNHLTRILQGRSWKHVKRDVIVPNEPSRQPTR